MGDTKTPNNMLHQAEYSSISILSYRVGLDTVATHPILQVRLNEPATSVAGFHIVRFIYIYIYIDR